MPKRTPTRRGQLYSVLTGDIIASTELSKAQMSMARDTLIEAAATFCTARQCTITGEPDFFRGDAWQILLAEPAHALALALYIRARLRSELATDTRVSIGIGLVHDIHPDRITLSNGEAFVLSGRALDDLTGYFDLTGAVPERAGMLESWFPIVLHLCSDLIRSWTQRQAELIAAALVIKNPTHERIAQSLKPKVVKQSVTDTLRAANWRALQEPINAFEETDWSCLLANV